MLYVIAGRPGVGKNAYLNKMKTVYGNSMCLLAASDYPSHSALLQELSIRIQNRKAPAEFQPRPFILSLIHLLPQDVAVAHGDIDLDLVAVLAGQAG